VRYLDDLAICSWPEDRVERSSHELGHRLRDRTPFARPTRQVKIPLVLWRQKSGNRKEGYVFESRNGTPIDLHNLIARVIKPHVEGKDKCEVCDKVPKKSGVHWKTLYAGRRGACTAAIEATNGNYAVAQALLRHKSMTTTLNVYKKQITPQAFKEGMKLLEAAATSGKGK